MFNKIYTIRSEDGNVVEAVFLDLARAEAYIQENDESPDGDGWGWLVIDEWDGVTGRRIKSHEKKPLK